jgi:hypothetical protein
MNKVIVVVGFISILIIVCVLDVFINQNVNIESYINQQMSYGQDMVSATPPPATSQTVYSGNVNTSSIATNTNSDPSKNALLANTNYDTNNYNIMYHPDASNVELNDIISPSKGTWVNENGKAVYIPWKSTNQYVTYYTSGAYPYGASSYVPTYEESIYLSKTTGQSSHGKAYSSSDTLGGFCTKKTQPGAIEQSCGELSTDQCASTMCCVLLGGSKCVSGDANGPAYPANYSDPMVINKDVYYYQGKCYGNCDNTNPSGKPYPRKPSDIPIDTPSVTPVITPTVTPMITPTVTPMITPTTIPSIPTAH